MTSRPQLLILTKTGEDTFNFVYLARRRPLFLPKNFVCKIVIISQVRLTVIAGAPHRVWISRCRPIHHHREGRWKITMRLKLGTSRRLGFQSLLCPVDFNLHILPLLQMPLIPDVELKFVGLNKDLKVEEISATKFRVTWNAGRQHVNKSILLCERVALSNPSYRALGVFDGTGECFDLGDSEVYFELDTDKPTEAVNRNQHLFDFFVHFTSAVKLHVNY